jgi:YbbR domain-containing protein
MDTDEAKTRRGGKATPGTVHDPEENGAGSSSRPTTEAEGLEPVRSETQPVSELGSSNGDETAAPSDMLAGLARRSANDVDPGDAGATTQVLAIDGDELSDRDLETLTASTLQGDAALARTAPRFKLAFPALQLDERLGRILLALVLAALLWLYVVSLENPTNTTVYTRLPAEPRNLAPQLKVINALPEVDATVQGPQSVLATLSRSSIRPYVDLAGISEGVHDVPVRTDLDTSKNDLTITFSPSKLQVQLESQVTQVFTVSAQLQGTPAFGYKPGDPKVTPDRVSVTGPKDAIARIAKVVVPVDIEGKAGIQQGSKTAEALDANGQPVTGLVYEPPTVAVEVPMQLLLNTRPVSVSVPILGQPAPGYAVASLVMTPTNVTVCCSPSQIEQIGVLETKPVAITGTTTSVITTTSLILPPGVELYNGQSDQITVAISVEPIQTEVRLSVAPTIAGLASGYHGTTSPAQVDVTVSGTFNQLQSLSPTSIRATVNADGRDPGTYTVTPQITVPQGVTVVTSSPKQLTLTIVAPTPVPTVTPIPQPTAAATATRVPEPPATSTPTHTPVRPVVTATPQPAQGTPSTTPTQSPTASPASTHTPTPGP